MKALLAFHNALVLWSDDTGDLVLHSGEGVYYGVTWGYDRLYVVARGNQPSRMRVFSPNMWPLEDLPFEHLGPPVDDGPHQALWWNGVLHVTNTQRNRVEFWWDVNDQVDYLYPSDERAKDDIDHVNSIWRDHDTGHFWVAEHRKQRRPKHIHVFNEFWEAQETIHLDLDCLTDGPVHSGLHNIYREGNVFYTLGPSQLIRFDLREWQAEEIELAHIEKYKHYLRGLARSKDNFFIGVSQAAERDNRGYGPSSVLVLDNGLNVIDKIDFDRRYGQLMEIRLVDEPDYAHNLIPCPLNVVTDDA